MSSENNQTDETNSLLKTKKEEKKVLYRNIIMKVEEKMDMLVANVNTAFSHKFVENLYICKPT